VTKSEALPHSLRRNSKAVSPAISTVILTSAIVMLLLVTVTFANNFLNSRMAENEFTTMQQFMQTVGLQIDDVAWTIGRTQTIRYASKFGTVNFQSVALNYSLFIQQNSVWTRLKTNTTGIILFNMPISKYSVSNNYFKRIFPTDSLFLHQGTSAPVNSVFDVENVPMPDGSYIRVVVAPSIRMLNATMTIGTQTKSYFKFYLASLVQGSSPMYSQSITITGRNVTRLSGDNVDSVRVDLAFPKQSLGFTSQFFSFSSASQTINLPADSVVEFYLGEVVVSEGLFA